LLFQTSSLKLNGAARVPKSACDGGASPAHACLLQKGGRPSPADTKPLRNLADALCAARGVHSLTNGFFQIEGYRRAAELLSLATRPAQAQPEHVPELSPLELGKDAHHLKQRLAGGCRRVHSLLVQEQVDPQGVQLGEEADKVLEAPAEPIDRPGHDTDFATTGAMNCGTKTASTT
jgi:hypothetical protein